MIELKVFLVTHSIEELLTSSSLKFGIQSKRLFTQDGGEIDDIKLIKDDDILYVSDGQPFIKIDKNDNNSVKDISKYSILIQSFLSKFIFYK
jgi:hypothetical protein